MVALQVPQLTPYEPAFEAPPRLEPLPSAPSRVPRRRLTKAEAYRRRRLVVLVMGVLMATGLVAALEALPRATPEVVGTEHRAITDDGVYIVQSGDSLWSIARAFSPDADPRPLVAELRDRHGAVELQVGDQLDLHDLLDEA